ncbi:unnamed protein product [Lactuca saligna]|uniref:Uncharacterized protein n=1 Tax=Lactuca saligna TaxID=75948 RepID=A0AA35V5X0_LACSI|nr:unnamed protein product [Lactuca saligna]
MLDNKQKHSRYKTSIKNSHDTMKACEVQHMIDTIIRQKIQTTKTIRTLKRNIRAAKAMQETLAKTLTERPHFLNYAISTQILDTKDAFNTKASSIVATLEEEINEIITMLNKVPDNLPAN